MSQPTLVTTHYVLFHSITAYDVIFCGNQPVVQKSSTYKRRQSEL